MTRSLAVSRLSNAWSSRSASGTTSAVSRNFSRSPVEPPLSISWAMSRSVARTSTATRTHSAEWNDTDFAPSCAALDLPSTRALAAFRPARSTASILLSLAVSVLNSSASASTRRFLVASGTSLHVRTYARCASASSSSVRWLHSTVHSASVPVKLTAPAAVTSMNDLPTGIPRTKAIAAIARTAGSSMLLSLYSLIRIRPRRTSRPCALPARPR